jgi:hypothetical protein
MGGGSQDAGLVKDKLHGWASLEVRDGRWLPGANAAEVEAFVENMTKCCCN